ncbi:hypothetical protein [Peristeroidobacter soli]|uniref:hypothetical protein n=1 Tax=Peristeroidobacter soli TaxID=2497877 RepID=UPI00130064AA|nr:hypothetical protein [Peristeroidobacter soli]
MDQTTFVDLARINESAPMVDAHGALSTQLMPVAKLVRLAPATTIPVRDCRTTLDSS